MKRTSSLLLMTALLLAAPAVLAEEASKTLTGSFVWDGRGTEGDLEAIFTPTGEGTWSVDFHFEFRGKPHTYSGVAEGEIGAGKLKGRVQNESKRRTFTFTGEFADGTFRGSHAEVEGEREVSTGTLMLE